MSVRVAFVSIAVVYVATTLFIVVVFRQAWSTAFIAGLAPVVYSQVFAIPLAVTRRITTGKSHEALKLWAKVSAVAGVIVAVFALPSMHFPPEQAEQAAAGQLPANRATKPE